MNDQFLSMTEEEIEDWLVRKMRTAEREADQINAAKLLMMRKRMIGHGNAEKKDFREVVIGGESESKAGVSSDGR